MPGGALVNRSTGGRIKALDAGAPVRPVRRHGPRLMAAARRNGPAGHRGCGPGDRHRVRRRPARRLDRRHRLLLVLSEQESRRLRRCRAVHHQGRGTRGAHAGAACARRQAEVFPRADRRQFPHRRTAGGGAAREAASISDGWTAGAARNAAYYDAAFARAAPRRAVSVTPQTVPGGRHIFNQYVVRAPQRDALRAVSRGARASAPRSTIRCRCTCRSASTISATATGDFPESERAAAETLALADLPGTGRSAARATSWSSDRRAFYGAMRRLRLLEVVRQQLVARQQLVEVGAVALREPRRLADVAGGDLQDLRQVVAREFVARLVE